MMIKQHKIYTHTCTGKYTTCVNKHEANVETLKALFLNEDFGHDSEGYFKLKKYKKMKMKKLLELESGFRMKDSSNKERKREREREREDLERESERLKEKMK